MSEGRRGGGGKEKEFFPFGPLHITCKKNKTFQAPGWVLTGPFFFNLDFLGRVRGMPVGEKRNFVPPPPLRPSLM